LGDAEKKLWTELEPLIRALLEELKKNGHIETVHANTEYEDLSSMLDNLEQSSKTYIAMMRIDDKDKLESFLGAVKGFGIDEQIMARIWLSAGLFVDVFSTELLKMLILFHLKGVSPVVSQFSITMEKVAPVAWSN
jgi:hypothetical protein